MAKRFSTAERRARRAAAFQLFVQRYARKTRSRLDPNDRCYDRGVAGTAKRLDPRALDALLRHGEEDLDDP